MVNINNSECNEYPSFIAGYTPNGFLFDIDWGQYIEEELVADNNIDDDTEGILF